MSSSASESRTPILDLESPLPKKLRLDRLSWRQALLIVGLPFVGFFLIDIFAVVLIDSNPAAASIFGYIATKFDNLFNGYGSRSPLLLFFSYFLTLFVVIAIHELGHVAGGLAVGFHFQRVRIGPLTLAKSSQGVRFSFQRISEFDGIALMRTQKLQKLRQKFAIYIAAGPCANLFSALCLWPLLASQLFCTLPHAIRQWLQVLAALSIFVASVNLIPYRRRNGMFTDGYRLLSFVTSKVKTRRLLSILALKMQTHSGVRLRDLKRTWIAHSCTIPDQSVDALQAFWIAYLADNDRKDAERAAQNLEKCMERFEIASVELQKLLLMEAAIFQAWFRNDEQKAKCWSQKSETYPAAPLLNRLRLTICLHWAGRRYDELSSAWKKGCIHIEALPASPAKGRLMDGWLEWKNEIDAKRATRETQQKS